MSIHREFRIWIEHLRRLGLPVVQMLLPGLSPEYIKRSIHKLGIDCSDDIVELYSFCGGVCPPEGTLLDHMSMYGPHYMLPFERAVQDYQDLCTDARWSKKWFPFFGNDFGDFYSLCSLSNQSDWGKICYFMTNTGEEANIVFSSLLNMMTVINECFDRGVCSVDDEGNLATRFGDARIIAMNHNKDLQYYR
jgi:hypothetical protein